MEKIYHMPGKEKRRNLLGSLGIVWVKGKFGGILVVEPPKYRQIPYLPVRKRKGRRLGRPSD